MNNSFGNSCLAYLAKDPQASYKVTLLRIFAAACHRLPGGDSLYGSLIDSSVDKYVTYATLCQVPLNYPRRYSPIDYQIATQLFCVSPELKNIRLIQTKEKVTMKTITESQVQVNGTSLQVELTNGASVATPLLVVACPASLIATSAPVFMTQLRGYSR